MPEAPIARLTIETLKHLTCSPDLLLIWYTKSGTWRQRFVSNDEVESFVREWLLTSHNIFTKTVSETFLRGGKSAWTANEIT